MQGTTQRKVLLPMFRSKLHEHIHLEYEYQFWRIFTGEAPSLESVIQLMQIILEYPTIVKNGHSNWDTYRRLEERLQTWSNAHGTNTEIVSKLFSIYPVLVRDHGLAFQDKIDDVRVKKEADKARGNGPKPNKRENLGEKTHRERSTSRPRGSGRR